MLAVRQRAGHLARQVQRASRTYASDAHAHHKPAEVNESFGMGTLLTVGTFIGGVLVFQFMPAQGEKSAIQDAIFKYTTKNEDWEEATKNHSLAMRQAAFDRNLFENGGNGQRFVDVSYPEALQSHSSRGIRAGHILNIDHVVEHYRQEHLKEEDRKAKKLAAERKE